MAAIKSIYEFQSSVQDAPSEVTKAIKSLQTIQTITNDLARDDGFDVKLDSAAYDVLQDCRESVRGLEALLSGLDVSAKRIRRKWNATKATSRKTRSSDFKRFRIDQELPSSPDPG